MKLFGYAYSKLFIRISEIKYFVENECVPRCISENMGHLLYFAKNLGESIRVQREIPQILTLKQPFI